MKKIVLSAVALGAFAALLLPPIFQCGQALR